MRKQRKNYSAQEKVAKYSFWEKYKMSLLRFFNPRILMRRRVLARITAGVLIVLFGLEMCLRLILGNNTLVDLIEFHMEETCIIGLRPNLSVSFSGNRRKIPAVTTSANEFGYRGKARTPNKSKDAYRIIIVGDSYTFCLGVADDCDYPTQLENQLIKYHSTTEVLNFGTPSANLDQLKSRYEKTLAYHPDLVVIQIAHNDFDPSLCEILRGFNMPILRIITKSYFLRFSLHFIIPIINPTNNEPISCKGKIKRFGKFVDNISEIAKTSNIKLLVTSFGNPVKCEPEVVERYLYNRQIPYMAFPETLESHLCMSGKHLDEKGCRLYAAVLADKIEANFHIPIKPKIGEQYLPSTH